MSPLSKINFKEWETEQLKDLEFVAEFNEPEPGYQITRSCIWCGLTQAHLVKWLALVRRL